MEKIDEREKAHYEALLLRNYLNELTSDEQAELFEALNNYPEVRRMDRNMQKYVKTKSFPQKVAISSILEEYEKFELITNKKVKRMSRNRWMVAAALLGGVILGAYFLFKPHRDDAAQFAEESTGVQLQLANGQSYYLDRDTIIGTAAGSLNVSQKQLQIATQNSSDESLNDLFVPAKFDYLLTLADGSTVQLNSQTHLKFPFSFGKTREVFIDGEAYFNIKQDPSKPFIVRFPSGQLQVLGTSFNINTYQSQLSTASLVSGSAEVTSSNGRVLLTPNIEASINRGDLTTQPFDSATTLSWRQGVIYFDATTLSNIAEVVQRWYDVKVILDEKVGEVKLTTRLDKNKPLNHFLSMLENTALVKYKVENRTIHIFPPN